MALKRHFRPCARGLYDPARSGSNVSYAFRSHPLIGVAIRGIQGTVPGPPSYGKSSKNNANRRGAASRQPIKPKRFCAPCRKGDGKLVKPNL